MTVRRIPTPRRFMMASLLRGRWCSRLLSFVVPFSGISAAAHGPGFRGAQVLEGELPSDQALVELEQLGGVVSFLEGSDEESSPSNEGVSWNGPSDEAARGDATTETPRPIEPSGEDLISRPSAASAAELSEETGFRREQRGPGIAYSDVPVTDTADVVEYPAFSEGLLPVDPVTPPPSTSPHSWLWPWGPRWGEGTPAIAAWSKQTVTGSSIQIGLCFLLLTLLIAVVCSMAKLFWGERREMIRSGGEGAEVSGGSGSSGGSEGGRAAEDGGKAYGGRESGRARKTESPEPSSNPSAEQEQSSDEDGC